MLPKKSNAPFYLMMAAVLTVIMTFLAMHMGYCEMILTEKGETDIGIFKLLQGAIETISSNPFCVFPPKSEYFSNLPVMLIFTYLLVGYVFYDEQRNKHDSSKIVQGSAKWNTDYKKYNKKYSDPAGSKKNDGSYNMILSEHVRLNMNTKKTFLNNNVLVIGGSGSGKTRYLLKPNILQANASYVITDPSGEILASTGTFLKEQGYKIKVFNLVDMVKSDRYNPFNYIRDETGVNQLINCLIKNTNDGKSGGDPFWEKSEIALLQALIFYLINHRPKKEQNFSSVMKLLRACQIDENNPDAKSKLDLIYEQIGKEDPNDVGYKSYLTFKMGAGKTLKSILISCGVRLNHFNIPTIANLTTEDTIDLKTLGDEKQALFIIIPAADDTYNFLVSMMYTQLFETLYYHAEIECPAGFYIRKENGDMDRFIQNEDEANAYLMEHAGYKKEKGSNHLAFHTRFLLDEFANVGQIPSFEKKIATFRKYEMSCVIILQNLAQLKNLYKEANEDIIGNCDSIVFLGGKSYESLKYLSDMLGKTTVTVRNHSHSKGGGNLSFNLSGRELLNPNEISLMEGTKCLVLIRGVDPFFDDKFDYPKHKNYHLTGDADSSRVYKIETDINKLYTQDELEEQLAKEIMEQEKELIGDTLTTEQFAKENRIKNPNGRFVSEQPESGDAMQPINTAEQIKNRTEQKKTVMDTIKAKTEPKSSSDSGPNIHFSQSKYDKKNEGEYKEEKGQNQFKTNDKVVKNEEKTPVKNEDIANSILNEDTTTLKHETVEDKDMNISPNKMAKNVADDILNAPLQEKKKSQQFNPDVDSFSYDNIPINFAEHEEFKMQCIREDEKKYPKKKPQQNNKKNGNPKKKTQSSKSDNNKQQSKGNKPMSEKPKVNKEVQRVEAVVPEEDIVETVDFSSMGFSDSDFF